MIGKIRTTNHKPPQVGLGSGDVGSAVSVGFYQGELENGEVGPLGRGQSVLCPRIDGWRHSCLVEGELRPILFIKNKLLASIGN